MPSREPRSSETVEAHNPRAMLAAALIAVALFAVDLWMFYPGLVTYDSIRQYEEALSGHYSDAHPPLMAAVWRVLHPLGDGALPMLILDLALYWGSFAALAIYCVRATGRWWASLGVLAGLFPFLLSFSGVIWKDVILAAAWGLSCALLLLSRQALGRPKLFWTLWLGAAFLLLFGSAMRHNAPPAAIVLACALVFALPLDKKPRLAIFACLAALAALAVPLSSRFLQAEDSGAMDNLIHWDLTGVSHFSGRDYRLEQPSVFAAHKLDCYSPRLFGGCELTAFPSHAEAVRRWRAAVTEQPLAYVEHRALVLSMLLRFGCVKCAPYVWQPDSQANSVGLRSVDNPARRLLGRVVIALADSPIGRPYVWLVAALGLAAMLWRQRRTPGHSILALIVVSGVVYALTYAVVAVTDEFRYIYWLIYSVVLVGAAWLFGSRGRLREAVPWVLAPVLIVAAAQHLVRSNWPTDHIAPSMATNY